MGMRTKLLLTALVLLSPLAACGDDDDGATAATTTSTTGGATIEVTAVDYAYEQLPSEVAVGTAVVLHNASESEVHELVGWLLPADEKRRPEELMALPEEEIGALLAGPPDIGLVALPGEDGNIVSGDGTFAEPGRYLVFCAIPTGATTADVQAALADAEQSDGPPEIPGGPPHFTAGMFGEVEVS